LLSARRKRRPLATLKSSVNHNYRICHGAQCASATIVVSFSWTADIGYIASKLLMIVCVSLCTGRKVFTAFATAGAGIQAMFFSDYDIQGFEGQEHIFSHVQRDMRDFVDRNIYGIELPNKSKSHTNNEPRTNR
jgi:hypothetical protein